MTIGFVGIFLGGVILLFAGQHGPWSFALPMFLITFSLGLSRPPSNNLVLEQVDRDAGSASSLLRQHRVWAVSMATTSLQAL